MMPKLIKVVATGLFAGCLTGCALHPSQPITFSSEPPAHFSVGTNRPAKPAPKELSPADYDGTIIKMLEQKWTDLVKSQPAGAQHAGAVVVVFRLHANGTVSDLTVAQNDAGALAGQLSEKAVKDCEPFPAWPSEMRKMVGKNYREIRFTFRYN